MATISEIKSILHKYIVETEDQEILNHVQAYFRSLLQKKGKIIGYTSDGQPLTIEVYKRDIDEARQQIREGKIISQEDLEKESENW
ncbi:hypothetical protein C900_00892 [Fulvivirga imtechensis AK7]|uniref:Uncharacterized protein n=1 Tax=Fulvivirga imtechensis AK7 TaxID=1237149 RepID=L8JV79_9BACT|nr:hypothetical protein [Fulvivirga imtechensis]ELR72931.1 hypothetical protein C900_00892 [Fulvivirga imtechensis AK7]